MVRAAVVLLFLVLLPSAVHAQKRVALVIGNSAYRHAPELANPKNDAADVAATLMSAGFQVIDGYDLDKPALDRKLRDFATALRGAEVGVFFYAGHGLQVSGQNYIAPVDAQLTTESALDFEMVRLDLVHRTMEREAPTNILFLDACRDNPLARNLARAMGTRSATIGRGLASIESGAGTLISFSTQPNNIALDGAGRNSPFSSALVKHLSSSHDDLGAILMAVRNDVMRETQRRQVPWEHSAMTGRFYFKAPTNAPPSTAPSQAAFSEAERAWNLAKDTKSIALLESFIARYKDTFYADIARQRIEQLKPNADIPSVTAVRPLPSAALPPKLPPPNPAVSNQAAPADVARTAWTPTQPVELIIPAGTGGGADNMARRIQEIVTKHNLMKHPMVVNNKAGGAGGEGFLDVKSSPRNPHKIIIALSNLFTTPLATGIPFNWKDMTPVAMLALDEFILWVNADTPYKSVKEYVDAVKKEPGKFKMGGTGIKQEDQIITIEIEKATGTKFSYVPFRGGGEVAVKLAGNHVDSTVNNPIEAVAQWREGKVRPLCVFDSSKLDYHDKIVGDLSWGSIPTCISQGLNIEYLMLRGIFMGSGATREQVDYYVGLFQKVRETPEWKDLMQLGAFNQSFITGSDYSNWIAKEEKRHEQLMKTAGFLAK